MKKQNKCETGIERICKKSGRKRETTATLYILFFYMGRVSLLLRQLYFLSQSQPSEAFVACFFIAFLYLKYTPSFIGWF